MNVNSREIFVSKKVTFEGFFFDWPLILLQAKAMQNNLKNLFSLICGFRIPVSRFWIPDSGFRITVPHSGFRFRIPLSGFLVFGLPVEEGKEKLH